jgi:hypothetical protein
MIDLETNTRRLQLCGYLWTLLLHVDKKNKLIDEMASDFRKPVWIRMSVHPTTTTAEIKWCVTV